MILSWNLPSLGDFHSMWENILSGVSVQFSSVTQWCLTLCNPMNRSTPGLLDHHQQPVYRNPCPLSRWCHPTISSFVVPFFSPLQSFTASGSSQMSQLFASCGQSMGVSASTSVLPMNIWNWFHLALTDWISLQSKGLSRVFSNMTVQKHLSHPYMTIGKTTALTRQQSWFQLVLPQAQNFSLCTLHIS